MSKRSRPLTRVYAARSGMTANPAATYVQAWQKEKDLS